MSYSPDDLAARHALTGLTQTSLALGKIPAGIAALGEPYRTARIPELRQLLIALTCPAPCVGYVNDEGWHKGCEARADAAIEALSLFNPSLPNVRPEEER